MDENSLETFLKFANSAYPILHEDVLFLSEQFLQMKKNYGNLIEKTFYEPMNVIDLIDRLIKKRPLCFVGGADSHVLRNGKRG